MPERSGNIWATSTHDVNSDHQCKIRPLRHLLVRTWPALGSLLVPLLLLLLVTVPPAAAMKKNALRAEASDAIKAWKMLEQQGLSDPLPEPLANRIEQLKGLLGRIAAQFDAQGKSAQTKQLRKYIGSMALALDPPPPPLLPLPPPPPPPPPAFDGGHLDLSALGQDRGYVDLRQPQVAATVKLIQPAGGPLPPRPAPVVASASSGESWLTAAIPMDNPYCNCKLTRVLQ